MKLLLLSLLLLVGCMTTASPIDPVRLEIWTKDQVSIAPVNDVMVFVHVKDDEVLANYQTDRVEILDGDKVIAAMPLNQEYRWRLAFEKVGFEGPIGRVGKITARLIDPVYHVESDSLVFKVVK